MKVKNSLVLSKSSNNKSDIIKTLNFYEYNNLGGNTNIWGAYINLKRFKKLLVSSKKFSNFYFRNIYFTTTKISKKNSFAKVGYIKNKKTNKIFRLDKSFFKNLINFNLNKIIIRKNFIELLSNSKKFKVKK